MVERVVREPVPAPARHVGNSSLREISSSVVCAEGCTRYLFTTLGISWSTLAKGTAVVLIASRFGLLIVVYGAMQLLFSCL